MNNKQSLRDVRCIKCKLVKPLIEFHRNKSKPSGHANMCRTCTAAYSSERYKKTRAKQVEYGREYYESNRAAKNEASKKYYQENKQTILARSTEANRTIKGKARQALHYAVKLGQIQKQSCEVCNEIKVEAHHYKGYELEHWFDVKWLCRKHHAEQHRIVLKNMGLE